jgi:hypothetical protein
MCQAVNLVVKKFIVGQDVGTRNCASVRRIVPFAPLERI